MMCGHRDAQQRAGTGRVGVPWDGWGRGAGGSWWPAPAGAPGEDRGDAAGGREDPPPRPPDERVGTAEREEAAALVSRAYVDGLLSSDELDDHLGRAYAAVTVADLDAATAVLPAGWRAEVAREERAERSAAAFVRARRGAVAAYVAVMVLLVGIWGVTALTAGAWYPWPIWPALGWGIPLLLSGRATSAARPALHGGRSS